MRDEIIVDKNYHEEIINQHFYRLKNAIAGRIRIVQSFQQANIAIYAFLNRTIHDLENAVLFVARLFFVNTVFCTALSVWKFKKQEK